MIDTLVSVLDWLATLPDWSGWMLLALVGCVVAIIDVWTDTSGTQDE